jgi:predicted ATPase
MPKVLKTTVYELAKKLKSGLTRSEPTGKRLCETTRYFICDEIERRLEISNDGP